MAVTKVTGNEIADGTLNRDKIDILTPGKALVTKIIAGTSINITSTGVDDGTGDVTINSEPILYEESLRPTSTVRVDSDLIVDADYAAALAGRLNSVTVSNSPPGNGSANASIIVGGWHNFIDIESSTHGDKNASCSSILGGGYNSIVGVGGNYNAPYNAIVGGKGNTISPSSSDVAFSTISGGRSNQIIDGTDNFIGGGQSNVASSSSSIVGGLSNTASVSSVISGGQSNIAANGSFVGVGLINNVQGTTAGSAIICGGSNVLNGGASIIGGGTLNVISEDRSGILAGNGNNVGSPDSSVVSGQGNIIDAAGACCSIGGGAQNHIGAATRGAICGGYRNQILGAVFNGFIGAGYKNTVSANHGSVVSGWENSAGAVSSLCFGHTAATTFPSELAQASGSFSSPVSVLGDAQTSVFVMRRTTVDDGFERLYIDGDLGSTEYSIPYVTEGAFFLHIDLVAKSMTGIDAQAWEIKFFASQHAGVLQLGTLTTEPADPLSLLPWSFEAVAVNSGGPDPNVVRMRVRNNTGPIFYSVRWVARVVVTKVLTGVYTP